MVSVFDCSLIKLPKEEFDEGNLTFVYNNVHIPFSTKRIFYTYDIPGGESRGAHAHKRCHQLLIAASGAYEVAIDDGTIKRTILLNRPYWGLYIPPGIWVAEHGFSSGSICLVLASEPYEEEDYIRSYEAFIEFRNKDKSYD